ncbi:hypothetical protein K438DRAFT_1774355 [Mycena galopus ATCC 62051]|nr:hypothetical protein K438DRAFT_1774355 [Mycena galopus ATCC 62051]
MPPCLGVLGTQEGDDWVAGWWKWWHNLQPGGRAIVDGELSRPEDADWSKLSRMYGKNGLLHVMATLCWWGEAVERRTSRTEEAEPGTLERWLKAVADVTWVLEQLLGANQMEREETQPKKTAKRKAKNSGVESDTSADEGEPQRKKARKRSAMDAAVRTTRSSMGRTRSSGAGAGAGGGVGGGGRPKPKPLYKGSQRAKNSGRPWATCAQGRDSDERAQPLIGNSAWAKSGYETGKREGQGGRGNSGHVLGAGNCRAFLRRVMPGKGGIFGIGSGPGKLPGFSQEGDAGKGGEIRNWDWIAGYKHDLVTKGNRGLGRGNSGHVLGAGNCRGFLRRVMPGKGGDSELVVGQGNCRAFLRRLIPGKGGDIRNW